MLARARQRYAGASALQFATQDATIACAYAQLAATALGLAMEPLSSVPYMFARLEGGDGFEGRARAELVDLRARYARLFEVDAATGELLR